jgi:phosphoglycolate phosphatase-like HAD superfamily hydrolase
MVQNEAIMIGDRDLDILSAKNAGIDACFFYDADEIREEDIHNADQIHSTADYIIHNFKELTDIL